MRLLKFVLLLPGLLAVGYIIALLTINSIQQERLEHQTQIEVQHGEAR